jgi:hypothetical protein
MKKLVWVGLSLLLITCGKPLPDLAPIDLAQWKDDKGGCHQRRLAFIEALKNQKDELKGFSEKDIIKILGRPDHNELYKRNQKFYYYDIDPGKSCNDQKAGPQLVIRFTAMGYSKEVTIESIE